MFLIEIQFFGFPVEQAMNLTDIDDKTIRGAISAGLNLKEFTDLLVVEREYCFN